MNVTGWIGGAAATLTTTTFIPQAWKVWHTRHTTDISMGMYILFTLGVTLWLLYEIQLESWSIIIANSVTANSVRLLLADIVLVLKMQFG